jgi:hypothetical protein
MVDAFRSKSGALGCPQKSCERASQQHVAEFGSMLTNIPQKNIASHLSGRSFLPFYLSRHLLTAPASHVYSRLLNRHRRRQIRSEPVPEHRRQGEEGKGQERQHIHLPPNNTEAETKMWPIDPSIARANPQRKRGRKGDHSIPQRAEHDPSQHSRQASDHRDPSPRHSCPSSFGC